MAIDNFQACLMAPTEILSRQHFETISNYLHYSNLNVSLLTGSSKKKERNQILDGIKNGQNKYFNWNTCLARRFS